MGLGVAKLSLGGWEGSCLAEEGWGWVGLSRRLAPGQGEVSGVVQREGRETRVREGSNEGLRSLDSVWPGSASQACS